ncbi:addiction module antidote protein [Ramlibacter sp. Leaf400]|uniref:addiction module antidote protein n=1 Tax=Ramlibacter sp. Leaf400 TaxID=1736365 RepID=UPI0009E9526C|nr:addiction module antidote protein [Ramlibacter sp. Leaf400]
MTNDKPLKVRPFDAAEYLTDQATIAEYLNACLELDDPAALLNAIGDVARAQGMSELARKTGLGRESLYKALAPGSHPRYDTILKVTQALGVELRFTSPEKAKAGEKRSAVPKRVRRVPAEVRAVAQVESRAKSPKKRKATKRAERE